MHIHRKIKPEHMNFKGIIIEILTIVFAVLFALGVESWWEHHNTMEAVEVSQMKLNDEIKNNLYEFVRIDTEAKIKNLKLEEVGRKVNNQLPFADMSKEFNGYSMVNLNVGNWKRILNDKISTYFPTDYMEDAFGLYQIQDVLEMLKSSLLQFVFSDLYLNKDKQKEAYEISKLYYAELLRHCKNSIQQYADFIKKYDSENYENVIAKCDSLRFIVKSYNQQH